MKKKIERDYLLNINYGVCDKCGKCARSCSLMVIEMVPEGPRESSRVLCNQCGHCAAICSQEAIKIKGMDPVNFRNTEKHNISFSQFSQLTRNRKSIRDFTKETIPNETLETLIESVKYIPTGANKQDLSYTIITNPQTLKKIGDTIARKYATLLKLSKIPIIKPFVPKYEFLSLQRLNENRMLYIEGKPGVVEPYLREAPCLIVIHSSHKNMLSIWEAGIASYHLILAAETLGLKTQLSGYTALTASLFPSIKKVCGVPKNQKILGAFVMGFGDIEFLKTVDRKPLNVKWL